MLIITQPLYGMGVSIEHFMGYDNNDLFPIDQLATLKARFDLVPELNLPLAVFPTQIHFPAIAQSGEVDQPNGQILDLDTHILNLMKQINRAFNTTFIFSTHDKRVIAKADRLIRVDDGEISALGVRSETKKWSLARQRRTLEAVAAEQQAS